MSIHPAVWQPQQLEFLIRNRTQLALDAVLSYWGRAATADVLAVYQKFLCSCFGSPPLPWAAAQRQDWLVLLRTRPLSALAGTCEPLLPLCLCWMLFSTKRQTSKQWTQPEGLKITSALALALATVRSVLHSCYSPQRYHQKCCNVSEFQIRGQHSVVQSMFWHA